MNNIEPCLQAEILGAVKGTIVAPYHRFWSNLSFCQRLWSSIAQMLSRTAELRVWQRLDRFGNRYWSAYDPATGRSNTSGSEAEMKAWIEELRYQK
ncbi:hypothetical protein [Leptolyngbya sp. FACHB-321]|uniref:hypothetical protein n=1 Tax=Leptolyngbya sp. FACHB-321 TaxID=2692807 RepID=UPI0018F015AE|nr:hypothetical protein [Leptolyngbya sp. FACHB-321]